MSATRTSPRAHESGHAKRLRREVFPPRPAATAAAMLVAGSALASFCVVVTAIGLAASAAPERPRSAPAVVHIIHTGDERPGASLPAVGEPSAHPTPAEDLPAGAEASLVLNIDGRAYAVLGDAPDELLDPASFELVGDVHEPEGAIANVAADALPGDRAAWSGREVKVGGDCTTSVEGFALVSPMIGSVDYMPLDNWEPEAADIIGVLLDVGETVIAAELGGCADAAARDVPALVRDAALPPATRAEVIDQPELERKARAHLLGSEAAREAQRDYAGVRDDAVSWWTLPSAEIDVESLRHPRTGEVLVSVRAGANEGCGMAMINLWGVYRVTGDGELEPLAIHELEPGARLHDVVDVDGDGELFWVATRAFGSSSLLGSDGEARASIEMPFFGCPC